jgi:tetratricopeptide (TPR) repeat protein
VFDEAMALFHQGEFAPARDRFAAAEQGSNREMCHAARLHISMCDQRLARMTPELNTPEDHYNYAIALINRRQLGEAERHLRIAADALRNPDHVLYAQALTRALQGDIESCYEYLKRAIELDGRNRSLARNDPDFQEFCRRPPLRELVNPPA